MGSPVRLLSKYHMALGSRGTAVWIDTHTESYYGRADSGQRLAASRPPPLLDPDDDEFADNSHEVEISMNVSTIEYCGDDGWAHVAVDEEEGKIAVGHLDGTITLYEYA
ncbi:hypothetical protein H0H87_007314 [Tephrocybe sp. NHM501043]|nr:hypothetical protein H0H87_007314 [Tephrocybe sp. NHM501043]